MHYANGRAAKIGDLVRGKGYNLKYEFTGILVFANPGVSACNCQVATVGEHAKQVWQQTLIHIPAGFDAKGNVTPNSLEHSPVRVDSIIEYGQLDAFVAIDPNTGEILAPESEQV